MGEGFTEVLGPELSLILSTLCVCVCGGGESVCVPFRVHRSSSSQTAMAYMDQR